MRKSARKLLGTKQTWQFLNIILLVVTLAGMFGMVWFGLQWFGGARVGGAQTEPVDAARAAVTKVLTISPENLDGDLQAVKEVAHGDFADEWAQGEDTLRKSVKTTGATTVPEILRAGYLKGDSDSATVLLIADSSISYKNKVEESKGKKDDKDDKKKTKWDKNGDGVPDSRTEHYRIKVKMALVEGAWKIATLELAK